MEIFAFHPGLDKWVEIGNSGMFRPEMLLPMVRFSSLFPPRQDGQDNFFYPGSARRCASDCLGTESWKTNYDQVSSTWGRYILVTHLHRYGIDNIRDLVGHKVDLDMVQKNPLCRIWILPIPTIPGVTCKKTYSRFFSDNIVLQEWLLAGPTGTMLGPRWLGFLTRRS